MPKEVTVLQELTGLGKWGAGLFVLAPMFCGLGWYWYPIEAAKRYGGNPTVPAVMIVLSSILFFASFVMLLVGRSYRVKSQSDE